MSPTIKIAMAAAGLFAALSVIGPGLAIRLFIQKKGARK